MFNKILKAILPNNSLHLHKTLAIFPQMFGKISWNVWRHSPEYLRTFPEMFEDIPRNVCVTFPKYNIVPIPRVPHILFPVCVILVLYIAYKNSHLIINTKLFIKILLCKNMLSERFWVFQKNSFIKEDVEQLKNKACEKHYHKIS